MNEQQRLFLVQARTDHRVFELVSMRADLPACHALHHLQMATELLGKACAWKKGRPKKTHRAFVDFLRTLSTNRQAQKRLGYEGQNEKWKQLIRKGAPLAQRIEDLAPALCQNGPNPEYPWPPDDPEVSPVEHEFEIWQNLQETAEGRQFLSLVSRLFAAVEAFL